MEVLVIITGIFAFFATNLDDMFLLAVFFAHSEFKPLNIVLGQYLGFITLILISSLAYFAQLIIPSNWISLLGIFPILIGIKGLLSLKNSQSPQKINDEIQDEVTSNTKIFSVAAVTISNGGDNLGVYMPLFASLEPLSLGVMISTFLVMVGVWCLLGYKLVNNRIFGDKIRQYGHLVLPFVMILIGVIIILKGWF